MLKDVQYDKPKILYNYYGQICKKIGIEEKTY